ncbi:MAG TPA: LLM class F420-dependent oxidoreductase [Acidimicrobiales bacterium]
MRVGLHIVRFDFPGEPGSIAPVLAEVATVAEEGGISALSVMDHWLQVDALAPVDSPMLEGYTTLGFLAGLTDTVRLRLLVSGVTYRHPGLLAKTVSTLDVLSGGRAELGIGAAWYEREHLALGVPYPPLAERFERLEETVQICRQMWSDDDGPYEGRHYQLAETVCSPVPISRPHPPILIGGGGEKKTLRFVARYADASNLMVASPDDVGPKLEVLRQRCDEEGRDYDTIRKTVVLVIDPFGDLDAFLVDCERYITLGVDEVVLMTDAAPVAYAERVAAEVVARVS